MSTATIPTWTLADRLIKARHTAGLTQDELAQRLGVGRKTIARYEDGKHPQTTTVMAWALACGVDPVWLLADVSPTATPTDGEVPSPFGHMSFAFAA